jgi:hypothetical protein
LSDAWRTGFHTTATWALIAFFEEHEDWFGRSDRLRREYADLNLFNSRFIYAVNDGDDPDVRACSLVVSLLINGHRIGMDYFVANSSSEYTPTMCTLFKARNGSLI